MQLTQHLRRASGQEAKDAGDPEIEGGRKTIAKIARAGKTAPLTSAVMRFSPV
jgi:hypothetical protein